MNRKNFKLFIVNAIDASLDLLNEGLINVFEAVKHTIFVKVKLIVLWILLRHHIFKMCVSRGDIEELLHIVLLWLDIGTRPILKQKDELRLIINQQIISQPIIENCTQNIGRLLVAGALSLYVLKLTLGWFLLCLVYDTAVGDGKLFVF